MTGRIVLYTRASDAHAWKFERTATPEVEQLARDTNKGYGIQTLAVPIDVFKDERGFPVWLDSCVTQEDADTSWAVLNGR